MPKPFLGPHGRQVWQGVEWGRDLSKMDRTKRGFREGEGSHYVSSLGGCRLPDPSDSSPF